MIIKYAIIIIILSESLVLKGQKNDSTVFSDYYILLNLFSRNNSKMDIGIERIKQIKGKWSYTSQISFTGGKWGNDFYGETYVNPIFYSLCLQPFHLLYGKNLKFETGPSANITLLRYHNKQLPSDVQSFNDALNLFYTFGLRYTFKKLQLSIKLIAGLKYYIDLQKKLSGFSDTGVGELGINWRLRKKVKKRIPQQ